MGKLILAFFSWLIGTTTLAACIFFFGRVNSKGKLAIILILFLMFIGGLIIYPLFFS